jgi:hypothetical protein
MEHYSSLRNQMNGINLPEVGCYISKVSPFEIKSNRSPWDHLFHGHVKDQQYSSKLPPTIFPFVFSDFDVQSWNLFKVDIWLNSKDLVKLGCFSLR